jgi:type IV pilus assembly protein PilB
MSRDEYFRTETVDLRSVQFTPDLLRCVPADIARRYRVLPIAEDTPISLIIAVADPSDLDAIDGIHFALRRHVGLRVADPRQLDEFIERLYGESA